MFIVIAICIFPHTQEIHSQMLQTSNILKKTVSVRISVSSSLDSGDCTLFKPLTWLKKIFLVSFIQSQLILVHRKASTVIKSSIAVGSITYISAKISYRLNIFSTFLYFYCSKDSHYISCSGKNLFRDSYFFN